MTRPDQSLGSDYFEPLFEGDADPWDLETSAYEAAKFAHSAAVLGGRAYAHALEVGCAGGSLTRVLAPSTADLLAVDISAGAVARARRRCADLTQVRVARMAFPRQVPDEAAFDLIVLSEVAYYWDDADLDRAAAAILRTLAPGGDLLLVHWTGETDYPQSGDGAVTRLGAMLADAIAVMRAERHETYRLDIWRRR